MKIVTLYTLCELKWFLQAVFGYLFTECCKKKKNPQKAAMSPVYLFNWQNKYVKYVLYMVWRIICNAGFQISGNITCNGGVCESHKI